MNTLLERLRAWDEGPSPQKKVDLVQIIVVISSGILSSTTIATVIKAWLDSRKTRLTIQIDGDRKILTYEGHHLNRDTPTIQTLVERLSEKTNVISSVGTVVTFLSDDAQKGEAS